MGAVLIKIEYREIREPCAVAAPIFYTNHKEDKVWK